MTPQAEAFINALRALCVAHQVSLYIGGDYSRPKFGLATLQAGEVPLVYYDDEWEDDTVPSPRVVSFTAHPRGQSQTSAVTPQAQESEKPRSSAADEAQCGGE